MTSASYYPYDSDAPAVFRQVQTSNYLTVAFLMLLVYDHAITLDKEIEWIWTLRWGLPKIIFIFNRYFIAFTLLIGSIPKLIFPVPIPVCNFTAVFGIIQPILNIGAVELLIIIRVCSLYGNRKLFVWSLRGSFVLALGATIALQIMFYHSGQAALFYEFLPGCWYLVPSKVTRQWPVWITFLSVEGILMLFTAHKLLAYRKEPNKTITILARDSIVYFVLIFASLAVILFFDFDTKFQIDIQKAMQCTASIAAGHMIMNIRGLILDDPEHTVHLRTLQFAARTNSASEIDEEV